MSEEVITDQAVNPEGQETTNEKTGGEQENNTFTQEDVSNIAAKESKRAQEKLLKELGIEDFDNAKEGIKQFREWQEAQKTEQEKQQERLSDLESANQDLQAQLSDKDAMIGALRKGVDGDSVEDVIVLAKKYVSDDVTIEDAIDAVLEKYPQFGQAEELQEPVSVPKWNTGTQSTTQSKSSLDHFEQKLKQYE
jgi:hypothetical protein